MFYITTTLPYVNAKPHIGFALETVQADVFARYRRIKGDEVLFNTGTDEHGAKIYEKALEEKKDPQEYCDEQSKQFDALKKALNLSYDRFIRTTNPHHVAAAQEFWKLCAKNGDIEKRNYRAKYCVGCELEKTDSELEDGRCPLHPNRELDLIDEENYFFKFSKYQKPLLSLYEKDPGFVLPASRMKEIKTFVAAGLRDFSISRLKSKMPWGIPVPDDPDHVIYVWFDALVNYISTLGWPEDTKNFEKYWPGVQIAGKDNLRQQSAMWQAMLLSAGLPTSKKVLIHGFITSQGQKMSKSLGNVVDPFALVEKYGTDAVRYFLLAKVPTFDDADFTTDFFEKVYTSDLVNGLGNLTSRVLTLVFEHLNGKLDDAAGDGRQSLNQRVEKAMDNYRIDLAMAEISKDISNMDKYVEETKPWALAKTDQRKLKEVLAKLVSDLKTVALELAPFLPETSERILHAIDNGPLQLFPRLEKR